MKSKNKTACASFVRKLIGILDFGMQVSNGILFWYFPVFVQNYLHIIIYLCFIFETIFIYLKFIKNNFQLISRKIYSNNFSIYWHFFNTKLAKRVGCGRKLQNFKIQNTKLTNNQITSKYHSFIIFQLLKKSVNEVNITMNEILLKLALRFCVF